MKVSLRISRALLLPLMVSAFWSLSAQSHPLVSPDDAAGEVNSHTGSQTAGKTVLAVDLADGVRSVAIQPEAPFAGDPFSIIITLPDENPSRVQAIEPVVLGPAVYDGADISPGLDGGTTVQYRLRTTGPGTLDLVDVAVRYDGRMIHLGTWVVDVQARGQSAPDRTGRWVCPAEVRPGQLFIVRAMAPDGIAMPCPLQGLQGVFVHTLQPASGNAPGCALVARQPGTLVLPAIRLEDASGPFVMEEKRVLVLPLPATAEACSAIGGVWTLGLAIRVEAAQGSVGGATMSGPAGGNDGNGGNDTGGDGSNDGQTAGAGPGTTAPGTTIYWELTATGRTWPGMARPPALEVVPPDGVPFLAGTSLTDVERSADGSVVTSRSSGAIVCYSPGIWTVRPLPYTWFDPGSDSIHQAEAESRTVRIDTAPVPSWPGEDTDRLRVLVKAARQSTAFPWTLSVPAREAATIAARNGNQLRIVYVLPSSVVFALPCGIAVLGTVILSIRFRRARGAGRSGILRLTTGMALLLAVLALASAWERRGGRYASLGTVALSSPADGSVRRAVLGPGASGTVLGSGGGWVLVELADGSAGWVRSDAIVRF